MTYATRQRVISASLVVSVLIDASCRIQRILSSGKVLGSYEISDNSLPRAGLMHTVSTMAGCCAL